MFRTGGQCRRDSGPVSAGTGDAAGAGRRVLYVCADRGIPLGGTKGASIHVREFIEALAAEGFTTTAAVRRRERAAAGLPCSAHVLQTDSQRSTLSTPAGLEAHEYAQNPYFVSQLSELHREQPFDFVYERYSLYSTAGLEFARQAGLPFVLEVNAPLGGRGRRLARAATGPLAREVEAHVSVRPTRWSPCPPPFATTS